MFNLFKKKKNNFKKELRILKKNYNSLHKDYNDLYKKYKILHIESGNKTNDIVSIWLSDLIQDFENNPEGKKLSGNWGYKTELNSFNWHYIFDDGRELIFKGNLKLGDSVTITLKTNEEVKIFSINQKTIKIIMDLLKPLKNKIKNSTNNKHISLKKLNKKELEMLMDKALDEKDFNRIKNIQKEIDNRDRQ